MAGINLQLFSNFNRTTISNPLSTTSTSITLASGAGAKFPNPTAGQQFTIILNNAATETAYEVCICTARSGDVLTVTRGQEGTSPLTWIAGDYLYCGVTGGMLSAMPQLPANNTWTGTNSFNAAVTVPTATAAGNPVPLSQAQADFAAINGTSDYTFMTNLNGENAEGDCGACAPGQSPAYVFNNQAQWGLYSASGGSLISYTRSGGVYQVGSGNPIIVTAGAAVGHALNRNNFPSSLGGNGYKKFADPNSPTGYYIEQWGIATSYSGGTTVYFPLTFPYYCLNVLATNGPLSAGAPSAWPGVTVYNGSAFQLWQSLSSGVGANGVTAYWRAIGY